MLVLMDRGFDGGEFLREVAATKAQFLVRLTATRRLPVLGHLPDGSLVSLIGGVKARIITAEVTVTCHDGTTYGGSYRLATTLLDHRAYPAAALIALYHERWEHEIAYLALRHTLLGGRVLRSGDPAGLEQEMWALLALYQALRIAVADAIATVPGTDPDRAGFRSPSRPPRRWSPAPAESSPVQQTSPATSAARSWRTCTAHAAPGLRPPGQIPAVALEQAPARQTPAVPADHQDHHHDPRRALRSSNTPPQCVTTASDP